MSLSSSTSLLKPSLIILPSLMVIGGLSLIEIVIKSLISLKVLIFSRKCEISGMSAFSNDSLIIGTFSKEFLIFIRSRALVRPAKLILLMNLSRSPITPNSSLRSDLKKISSLNFWTIFNL